MASTTLRASISEPSETSSVCARLLGRGPATSRIKRKVVPNTHACWYARVASSPPATPRWKPR